MRNRSFAAAVCLAVLGGILGCAPSHVSTQQSVRGKDVAEIELDSGWICTNYKSVKLAGEDLSKLSSTLSNWLPATVPGTVLTTLLNNKLVSDPYFGMNNTHIPDIYDAGRDAYTYWFVKDFQWAAPTGTQQVYLRFRGVNYGCDIYLNGQKLTRQTHYGMFLRQAFNITSILSRDGNNRLAVLVYPPDPVGNPNGGQGGDGTIGRNVSNQYVAGWDWIQPIRDRNTGIWDKVTLDETGGVCLTNPHVITLVPGRRFVEGSQAPAIVRSSAEIENPTSEPVHGSLRLVLDGRSLEREVRLQPMSSVELQLPDDTLYNPRLWWPNGSGPQALYDARFQFLSDEGAVLDEKSLRIGVREIRTAWNDRTESREVYVNGQTIFIKGGNWITSDAMLRLSAARYDAEVHFHRDMNLNLIRIWGGALTERPEFYDACDKYGILVFQDFWISGDCNGKWRDPMKKEDQWTRRMYPDDHALFLHSVVDQVKMIRNHPSLAFYCGGNEIPPPEDILRAMQDSLLPALDPTRYFFTYSNADSMSHNFIGGNGDGPYRLQGNEYFWEHRSFPFNSETGSVGMGDYESLQRFIPPEDLQLPDETGHRIDSVWRYHKYAGYGKYLDPYGKPSDVRDFAAKAQLVNYDQYRALIEGHLAHMWEWYTGVVIWKTQNPWTAMRGQMYDCYLDPNACLYGLQRAGEPLHVMRSPSDGMLMIVNNTFHPCHDLMVQARSITCAGKDSLVFQWVTEIGPATVQKIDTLQQILNQSLSHQGGFLALRLLNATGEVLSDNLYWLPDDEGNYTCLQHMASARVHAEASRAGNGRIAVTIQNPSGGPLAFFNRISLVDGKSHTRILPTFYSDNYISILPGEQKTVNVECRPEWENANVMISISGWNVAEQDLPVK
ncbi:MAG TPA: glycoside hydrolase family 2 TIM barrel-domain containing protein [Bacteroidota bacterium]|nr:glycoside hydrolase family 2 TIM barrel-domain containing protein [Bacteroidota bacterium]